MGIWQRDSMWFQPVLGIDYVAELLDIRPASVRRYLTDPHSGFPEPAELRGNRNFWTPASIHRHIWNTKPSLIPRVPRLCPLSDDVAAAQFVESEVIETRGYTYVLHTWQPGDGRGPVGVAYCKDFARTDEELAAHLLSLRPYLSAVAMPRSLSGLKDPLQPRISVAEADGADWYPGDIGWLDLTALLRVDLPWWSHGLTDVDAMNAWRPGAPVAEHLRPRVADFTAEHFEQCRPHDGSRADQALAEIVDATDRMLAAAFGIWPHGRDDYPNRAGLQHAAVAVLSAAPPKPAEPGTIRDALRHRVDDKDLAVRAVNTARGFDVVLPAITHDLLVIAPERCSELAREWCDRLTPVDPLHRSEIGFHWVTHQMDQPPHQWWRDPRNDNVWAISAADGTLYATLGTRMPAHGRIEELAVEDLLPFFRDSRGDAFAVPSNDGVRHYTSGSSASRLTAAILSLLDDAARDVYRSDLTTDVLDTQATGLYETISGCNGPIILSRSDLEQLAHETARGAARRDRIRALAAGSRGNA